MIGAIAGDIIGSVYEHHNTKTTTFEPLFDPRCHFTDDTILTVAIADAILTGSPYSEKLKEYYRAYPGAGYGPGFRRWAASNSTRPRYSAGNGSAMRVSPVAFAFDTLDRVLNEARKSAEVTHNHPEGIKGAQAVASAVFLARTGEGTLEIKKYIEDTFGYNLDEPIDKIREHYKFDATCQGSVPQAIRAFLEGKGYEDTIRKAISIGGDSDTIACIAGGIAYAFNRGLENEYGFTDYIRNKTLEVLDDRLRTIVLEFEGKYINSQPDPGRIRWHNYKKKSREDGLRFLEEERQKYPFMNLFKKLDFFRPTRENCCGSTLDDFTIDNGVAFISYEPNPEYISRSCSIPASWEFQGIYLCHDHKDKIIAKLKEIWDGKRSDG